MGAFLAIPHFALVWYLPFAVTRWVFKELAGSFLRLRVGRVPFK